MYNAVPAQVDLPAMERAILDLWDREAVFELTLQGSADRPLWTFYEGPPTANGTPGAHHVEARVFKDIFPRYRTMKGYFVPRQAGWDCHGLPGRTGRRTRTRFQRQAGHRGLRHCGVQRTMPRVGPAPRRRIHPNEHPDGLLGRYGFGLLDDESRLHPKRVVVP